MVILACAQNVKTRASLQMQTLQEDIHQTRGGLESSVPLNPLGLSHVLSQVPMLTTISQQGTVGDTK